MAKTLDSRLDDAAVALVRHLGTTGYGILAAVLSTLELPANAARRERILGALSLGGGWRGPASFRSEVTTEARKLRRALIAARLTIGGQQDVDRARRGVTDMPLAHVTNELLQLYAQWLVRQDLPPAVVPSPRLELAPSFSVTNSYEQYAVTHCINRAIALTGMARDAVQRATTDPSCCFLFTKWFGVPEPRRVSKVLDNFARLHGAIAARPMVLYYRGPKIAPNFPDDEPGGQGYIVKPEPKIFAETFGSRNGVGPPPFSPNRTYIWLGGLFFDEQRSTSRSGFDSQAGVFIHELSHAFCDTDDVDWKGYSAYGQDTCQEIALEDPDLAVKNADNYEYFAEEFQVNLYDEDGQFERNAARAAAAGSQIRSHSNKPAFKNCSTRSQVKSLAGRAQRSPWTVRG